MADTATRIRRMRSVLDSLVAIDPDAFDLPAQVRALRIRARLVLEQNRLNSKGRRILLEEARKKARKAHARQGEATRRRMLPIIAQLRAEGFNTYRKLADELNSRHVLSPRADKWSPGSVHAVEKRLVRAE